MAMGPTKLGRIWCKQQAAWGTAITAFADADAMNVQGMFVPAFKDEALGVPVQSGRFGTSPLQAGSRAGATASLTWTMTHSADLSLPHIEHRLIADALGVMQVQAGIGTIANTSIDSRLDVTTANADWIGQGALIGLTGGGKQIVWVKDVDLTTTPDEVDITAAIAVPDSAVSVLRTITIAFDNANLAGLPFSMEFASSAANAGVRAWDGRVSQLTVTLSAKGQMTCAANLTFLNWAPINALTAPAFTFPRTQLGPNINAISVDGSTDAEFCYSELTVTVTQTLTEATCNGSAQGVSQLVTSDRTVAVVERMTATDIYTDAWQAPGTQVVRQWGATSRNVATGYNAAIYGALLDLSATSNPVDLGGIWGIERAYQVPHRLNTGDGTAGASTVKQTNFRISFA